MHSRGYWPSVSITVPGRNLSTERVVHIESVLERLEDSLLVYVSLLVSQDVPEPDCRHQRLRRLLVEYVSPTEDANGSFGTVVLVFEGTRRHVAREVRTLGQRSRTCVRRLVVRSYSRDSPFATAPCALLRVRRGTVRSVRAFWQ